jgi:hypothetical protein
MKRLALLLVLACTAAHAQTVYRCGPEGRVYSQTPCPNGRAVDVSDARSAEQRAAAETRVRGDQALGDSLERERRDRESELRGAGAGKIDGRPAPAEAPVPHVKAAAKKKAHKTEGRHFEAIAPQARRASL